VVVFSVVGGAAVYHANRQVADESMLKAVPPLIRTAMQWGVQACMLLVAGFMLGFGAHLCYVTRSNTIAEFPSLSTGIVYLPVPIGGLLTPLFIVEKIWLGEPPKADGLYSHA